MNTGRWGKGGYNSPQEALIDHFTRHGAEVGATDVEHYLRKAEGFAQNLRGATKSLVSGATPGVIRYKKLGKYIDIAPDGSIISFGAQ
jgi:pyocin large subunit-like protein